MGIPGLWRSYCLCPIQDITWIFKNICIVFERHVTRRKNDVLLKVINLVMVKLYHCSSSPGIPLFPRLGMKLHQYSNCLATCSLGFNPQLLRHHGKPSVTTLEVVEPRRWSQETRGTEVPWNSKLYSEQCRLWGLRKGEWGTFSWGQATYNHKDRLCMKKTCFSTEAFKHLTVASCNE